MEKKSGASEQNFLKVKHFIIYVMQCAKLSFMVKNF